MNIVKVNTADAYEGEDWLVATLGTSSIDNKDYIITSDHIRASEIDSYLPDPKNDAELIVKLLNKYFAGEIAVYPTSYNRCYVNLKTLLEKMEELEDQYPVNVTTNGIRKKLHRYQDRWTLLKLWAESGLEN